jgi:hypothetical protein
MHKSPVGINLPQQTGGVRPTRKKFVDAILKTAEVNPMEMSVRSVTE